MFSKLTFKFMTFLTQFIVSYLYPCLCFIALLAIVLKFCFIEWKINYCLLASGLSNSVVWLTYDLTICIDTHLDVESKVVSQWNFIHYSYTVRASRVEIRCHDWNILHEIILNPSRISTPTLIRRIVRSCPIGCVKWCLRRHLHVLKLHC